MSLACGRTRSTVVANRGAAAVARAEGFESAMTHQWYTNAATETSRPMKIRALGHVSLFVRDLDATRRFYRDLLGLAEKKTMRPSLPVPVSARPSRAR